MLNLIDLLYPKYCLNCHHPGQYLCSKCLQLINFCPQQKCPICNQPSYSGLTHKECKTPYSINGIYAIATRDPHTMRLITQLKYRFASQIAQTIIHTMLPHIPEHLFQATLITSIPLHPSRQKWRGYNQSQLLARHLSKHTGIPSASQLLIKTRNTAPQATITDRHHRLSNLDHAFKTNPKLPSAAYHNQNILIIDDITTTGATLNQAATPLKQAGAHGVWGLVFCR